MSRLVSLCALLAVCLPALAQNSFYDDFNSTTLDPAWTVVSYTGTRSYGYTTPANSYSLTASPGNLRYSLEAMTHEWGFVTNYQQMCCWYDPGLDLVRTFTGDRWTFETKMHTYMPFTNGRGFRAQLAFGSGGPGTYLVQMWRQRDVNQNWWGMMTWLQSGTNWDGMARVIDDVYENLPLYGPADETGWFRVRREGSVITAWFSFDGTSWTQMAAHDFGTALDGLPQRVILNGESWFVPAGSYADWDYVSLAPLCESPSIANLTATPNVLWPPNRKMRDVTLSYDVSGGCGSTQCTVSVTSSEAPEFEVLDATHIRLMSWRTGTGTGRVYTITTTCTDDAGNTTSSSTTVTVPHNQ